MDGDRRTLLTRLADGEATPAELREAAAWRDDSEAVAMLAELAGERALLRAAFPLEGEGHAAARRAIDDGFAARRRPLRRSWSALPIAASVAAALIVGGGAVYLAERRAEDTAARMIAAFAQDRAMSAAAFTDALDRQVSGHSVAWHNPDTGSSGSVTPLRTFRAADGRYCREYQQLLAMPGGNERRTGVACREAQGWRPAVERPDSA